jgi:hypothetical protein
MSFDTLYSKNLWNLHEFLRGLFVYFNFSILAVLWAIFAYMYSIMSDKQCIYLWHDLTRIDLCNILLRKIY